MADTELHSRTLSMDVSEFVDLLGDIIKYQTSGQDFDTIEEIRTDSIAYRNKDIESRDTIREEIATADPESQEVIARAFTSYFAITNLAEERQRVRKIRRGQHEGTIADSIEAAIGRLQERGASVDELQGVFEDVLIEPTFTAHPTEARRKTVKAKFRTIAQGLRLLDEQRLTEREENQLRGRLESQITSLWQTALVRDRRPEVTDEVKNVRWYLENVLFDVVSETYEELDRVLEEDYAEDIEIPKLYEFRSWAGSDRDGNPYVTPEVTEETLDRQRNAVLSLYREELGELTGVLSQDKHQISAEAEFDGRLEVRQNRLPSAATEIEARYPNEPYRQFLELMRESLSRVSGVLPGGYRDEEEFVEDIEAIEASLHANSAEGIADSYVAPLRRKAETFGFTLASLDLRDHQQEHTLAVTEALGREDIDYDAMSEDERVEFLTEAVLQDGAIIDLSDSTGLSDRAERVLTRFDSLADWQREYGVSAIDTYCISMCEEPSHVLEVLFLADQSDVVNLPDHCGLDLAPLLETEYALSGADRIMGTLFENEAYAQALSARNNLQEIMLGYSDSNKENGFLAANWSLYVNQKRLAEVTDDYDVEMRLFHGRGGSISRGGGPMNDALLALPRETVNGQVKFTEQGEAISEKYANPRIAERNLEQMLNAQIRARYDSIQKSAEQAPDEWYSTMETAAAAARESYCDLLETDGFVEFFEQTTPIPVIEDLNLGSRPASRTGERTVEDLRTIPWVFSWTQARCIIPGWYSLASGFDAYLENGGDIETLQDMYEGWPFFRTTLDNAALALARTDMGVAQEYIDLASPELADRFFGTIEGEYDRACELMLEITDRDYLIERSWLRDSISRRNPYVDPLNLLQVQLLDKDEHTELEQRVLRLTVKGIAAGMQNTG